VETNDQNKHIIAETLMSMEWLQYSFHKQTVVQGCSHGRRVRFYHSETFSAFLHHWQTSCGKCQMYPVTFQHNIKQLSEVIWKKDALPCPFMWQDLDPHLNRGTLGQVAR